MAQEVVLDVKLNGSQADGTVKTIKAQLKEANAELVKAQQLYGDYSKEALTAAKQVAGLKDRIQEARETADLFDPGKKFQAFTGVLNTVAGGFSALQGAIALTTGESEELNKALLKVQSALAISQGLSAIADSGKDFARLASLIKGPVVAAFTTLRGAIIATGVGALAVGLGLLIANFDKVKTAVLNLIPGLGTVAGWIGNLVQKVTDFVGITSEASRELDKLRTATEAVSSSLENQIRILEAQGGREDEVYKLKRQRIEGERKLLLEQQKVKGDLSKEEVKTLVDLNTQLSVVDATETNRRKKVNEDRAKDAQEAAYNRAVIEQNALKEQFAKEEEAYNKRKELRKKEQEDIKLFNQIAAENKALEDEQRLADEQKFNESLDKLSQGTLAKFLDTKNKETIAAQQSAEAKQKIEEMYLANKQKLVQMEIDLLFSLSEIVGQQTVAGKALAIAAATINTYQAASEALKANYGPFGPVAAVARFVTVAATIANGLKQVKSIVAVQIPGGSGGGSAPSISGGAPAPINAPLPPTVSRTAIDQATINSTGNAADPTRPVRVYAITGQITNEQEVEQRLARGARLGP